jgi:hypothetical protein
VLNFYQINRNGKIRTRNRLVIKALIPCQRTNSTQKLKLLDEIPRYDLYYSLTESVENEITTIFKSVFHLEMYQNNIFLFKKNYFCYQHIKRIKNIKIIILNKK